MQPLPNLLHLARPRRRSDRVRHPIRAALPDFGGRTHTMTGCCATRRIAAILAQMQSEQGYEMSSRGRIRAEIVQAFHDAH
ncbi:Lsr2 family DNA-binding protein [Rhodococcus sp. LB1]|uniref:Lsr2 family DNA-binding protein n=1 Tax=Rhodococcus sp. LB1 TaxID=1807499 RepID=UPI000B194F50